MQASVGAEAATSDTGHMDSKNLYEVLEIGPAATAKDIKRAYRKLAREIHPDQAASPEEKKKSTLMFLRIHNAYVTLSDPHDRALYDRQLSAPMWGFPGQTGSKATSERPTTYRYCGHLGRSWESDQCW
jgi:DnaJ-class molecular chaperone